MMKKKGKRPNHTNSLKPRHKHTRLFSTPSKRIQSQQRSVSDQINMLRHNTDNNYYYCSISPTTPQSCNEDHDEEEDASSSASWPSKLLLECSEAIFTKDSAKTHQLLWILNELSSPYGDDSHQRLAYYFLQALFCRISRSGRLHYETLVSVAEKSQRFDSAARTVLKFQEVSPWTTFGHAAANGAILDAVAGEGRVHVVDISSGATLCTQWPTFLEALATRNHTVETPRLRLTVVMTSSVMGSVMKETAHKMEKFAKLMGVPFELDVITQLDHPGQLKKERLLIRDDEAVAVNCVGALRDVPVEERPALIQFLKTLNPKIITVVEEEADFVGTSEDFVQFFQECLRFYTLYFEMLHESFKKIVTCNERLMLERECSRGIFRVLGDSEEQEGCERRERGSRWRERLRQRLSPVVLNDDVLDDVKALLKRYAQDWSVLETEDRKYGVYLTWKQVPVVWASAWKP